jgi:glycosyltransferase involved in cell wall biosynthesis
MAGRPLVSVITPVRDDVTGLRGLLSALDAQTLPSDRFEVVIGDDGAPAGSLEGLDSGDGRVRVVSGPPQTSYAARNRAAASARGDVLAFCDSDCLPEPAWLELGLAALEQADIVAGEVAFVVPARPTAWSVLTMDMFLDQEQNVLLSRGVTANLFVRRKTFDEVGRFDDSLPSGGDYDFVRRAVERGARLAYARDVVVRHPTIDRARPFLGKVWSTNRWSALRRARAGERPDLVGVVTFVPVLGVALARRHALRPALRLQRRRLEASGLRAGLRDELRALSALYFVVAYVAGLGRVRGWIEGRRLARSATPSRKPV